MHRFGRKLMVTTATAAGLVVAAVGGPAASAATIVDTFSGSCSGGSSTSGTVVLSTVAPPTFGLEANVLTCYGTLNGVYGTWRGSFHVRNPGVAGGTCSNPEFVAGVGDLHLYSLDTTTSGTIDHEVVFAPRTNSTSRRYSAQVVGQAGGLASLAFTWVPYEGCADNHGQMQSVSLLTSVPLQG